MRDSLIGRRVLASRIGVFGVWRSREVLSVEHTAGRDIALMPNSGSRPSGANSTHMPIAGFRN